MQITHYFLLNFQISQVLKNAFYPHSVLTTLNDTSSHKYQITVNSAVVKKKKKKCVFWLKKDQKIFQGNLLPALYLLNT